MTDRPLVALRCAAVFMPCPCRGPIAVPPWSAVVRRGPPWPIVVLPWSAVALFGQRRNCAISSRAVSQLAGLVEAPAVR
jgi:hypothetical protein